MRSTDSPWSCHIVIESHRRGEIIRSLTNIRQKPVQADDASHVAPIESLLTDTEAEFSICAWKGRIKYTVKKQTHLSHENRTSCPGFAGLCASCMCADS